MDSGTQYDNVEKLKDASELIVDLQLSPMQDWKDLGYTSIEVQLVKQKFVLPVDTEYDDPVTANKAMQLHMILRALKDFEQSKDFLEWSNDLGIDSTSVKALHLFRYLVEIHPAVQAYIDPTIQPLPGFDVEMNTGPMQSLREWNGTGK